MIDGYSMYVFFYFSTIIQMILSASFLQNVVIFPHFVTSQGAVFTYIMQKKKKNMHQTQTQGANSKF